MEESVLTLSLPRLPSPPTTASPCQYPHLAFPYPPISWTRSKISFSLAACGWLSTTITNTELQVDTFRCDGLKGLAAVDAVERMSQKVVAKSFTLTRISRRIL